MKTLIQKIEEKIPKEMKVDCLDNGYCTPLGFRYIGYNQALQEVKQSIPQMLEVVKEEIKKVSDFADSLDTYKKRIINLLSSPEKKLTNPSE